MTLTRKGWNSLKPITAPDQMPALVTRQKARNFFNGRISRDHKKESENLHKYRNKKVSRGRRSIRRQRYAIQPYDTVRLEGKTYITSGCHNKGTRLLIPVNGKSKSVAISKVQVVCHAGAWIQII